MTTIWQSGPRDAKRIIREYGPVIVRPSDKKDHYVKRCVAVAGDTLEIRDGLVYVNSEAQTVWPGVQNTYRVVTTGQRINPVHLDELGLNVAEAGFLPSMPGYPQLPLTEKMVEAIGKFPNVVSVTRNVDTYPPDFPDSELTISLSQAISSGQGTITDRFGFRQKMLMWSLRWIICRCTDESSLPMREMSFQLRTAGYS